MLESLKKNRKGILIMLCSSLFACVGQLLWKLGGIYGVWMILIGFGFYAFGALFMLYAYRFGSVSVLQPVMSMNYVISVILGALVLKEPVTILKVIGVIVIMIGVILIGGGEEKKPVKEEKP
ncbi:MAG: EamA family transporter [Lachnospiraceae bacterium]|nr:EamA family transporter [Lachnospiraceae bacterium]